MRYLATRALFLSTLFLGCSGSVDSRTRLSIFAASSLTDSFQALAAEFEAQNPAIAVELAFAGSQVLRLQIEQGASVDLFASANQKHLQELIDEGYMGSPRVFASTDLVMIVPLANPAKIETFRDLTKASRIVFGNEFSPIGLYTLEVLERATADLGSSFGSVVSERIASLENNVRMVRAKVELGEADAALVYRPDAITSSGVLTFPIPDAWNVLADFPVAVSTEAPRGGAAAQFLEFLSSPVAQELLAQHGFVSAS